MPNIDDIRKYIIVRVNNASGVIISPLDKDLLYIFTCKHVVEDKVDGNIVVRYDQEQNVTNIAFEVHNVLTDDISQSDVAIIIVRRSVEEIPHIYPSSEKSNCYHIGFPTCRTEATDRISNIRVSDIYRFDGSVNNTYIEYEYRIPPRSTEVRGMSGGGIFNDKGCLVGIHTQSSVDDENELLGKGVMIPVSNYLQLISSNNLSPVYEYDLSRFGDMVTWVFDFKGQDSLHQRITQFSTEIAQFKKTVAIWSPEKIMETLIGNNKVSKETILENLDKDYWRAFTLFLVGIISFLDLDEADGEKAVLNLYNTFHYCYSDKEYDIYKVRERLSDHHLIGKVQGAYLIVGGLNKTYFGGCYILPNSKVPDISTAHIIDKFDISIAKEPLLSQITIINNNIFERAVEKCAENDDIEVVTIDDYRKQLKRVINI